MKLAALLSGALATVVVWLTSLLLTDMGEAFLALWPQTNSQQFFGSVAWHTLGAAGLVGGLVTVLRPTVGGLLLIGAAAGWVATGRALPTGFDVQLLAPLVLTAFGGLAAFGAAVRGLVRRRATRRATSDQAADDEDERVEPIVELQRTGEDIHQAAEAAVDAEIAVEATHEHAQIGAEAEPAEERVRRAPRSAAALVAVNIVTLLVLSGAVALLFYVEIRTGHFAAAFKTAEAAPDSILSSQAKDDVVQPTEATVIEEATASVAPSRRDLVATALRHPQLMEAATAPAEVRVSRIPLEAASAGPTAWNDPFDYCAAVGTIDFPDRRYAGPALVASIAESLRVPTSSSPDRVKWRCVDGEVWACASFDWPVCAMTPSVGEMVEFCSKNPNAIGLQAPNGNWSCEGTRPAIPDGETWPVDTRGFLPGAWIEIEPPSPPGSIG